MTTYDRSPQPAPSDRLFSRQRESASLQSSSDWQSASWWQRFESLPIASIVNRVNGKTFVSMAKLKRQQLKIAPWKGGTARWEIQPPRLCEGFVLLLDGPSHYLASRDSSARDWRKDVVANSAGCVGRSLTHAFRSGGGIALLRISTASAAHCKQINTCRSRLSDDLSVFSHMWPDSSELRPQNEQ
jgi:hypothetical protein